MASRWREEARSSYDERCRKYSFRIWSFITQNLLWKISHWIYITCIFRTSLRKQIFQLYWNNFYIQLTYTERNFSFNVQNAIKVWEKIRNIIILSRLRGKSEIKTRRKRWERETKILITNEVIHLLDMENAF